MTITKTYYSKSILYTLAILITIPAVILFIGYTSEEVIDRSVDQGKVLEVVQQDASEHVAVKMQLSSGQEIRMESLPKTVKIGDELPIIVEHYFNEDKLTYRFDRHAWNHQ